jgi:hypothetical protein
VSSPVFLGLVVTWWKEVLRSTSIEGSELIVIPRAHGRAVEGGTKLALKLCMGELERERCELVLGKEEVREVLGTCAGL